MFAAIERLTLSHAKLVLVGAAIFFVIAAAFGGQVAKELPTGDSFVAPHAESSLANSRLGEIPGQRAAPGVIVIVDAPDGAKSAQGLARVDAVVAAAKADRDTDGNKDVKTVTSVRSTKSGAEFISKNGKASAVLLFAAPVVSESDIGARLATKLKNDPWATVGGPGPAFQAIAIQATHDLGASEKIAFPLLFLLSLFVFRGVVAALLPLFGGRIAVVGTFPALPGVNQEGPVSIFAPNLASALGLGLAIDWSL